MVSEEPWPYLSVWRRGARGARFDEGGLVERIRIWGSVLTPLVVGLFRRADRLAGRPCRPVATMRLPAGRLPRTATDRSAAVTELCCLWVSSDVHGGSGSPFL
ncbi:MAG: hypothetical protein ACLTSX_03140 [Collinsella sp.]